MANPYRWGWQKIIIGLIVLTPGASVVWGQEQDSSYSRLSKDSIADTIRKSTECDFLQDYYTLHIKEDDFVASILKSNVDTISLIASCPEANISVLQATWPSVAEDSSDLDRIMWLSSSVRDTRIENLMVGILKDNTKPIVVKQAAIRVLISYVENRVGGIKRVPIDTSDTVAREPRWYTYPRTFTAAGIKQIDGKQPLTSDFRKRMERMFYQLAMSIPPDSQGWFSDNEQRIMYKSFRDAMPYFESAPRR